MIRRIIENKMKITLILFICLTGFSLCFGQEKVITQNEFDVVYAKWKRQSKDKSYRVKQTLESKLNGTDSNRREESTSEYAPNDKRRFVFTLKTPIVTKSETIYIENKKYTRKNEGEWKEELIKPKVSTQSERKIEVESNEYKYLGQETINTQATEIYVHIAKHKINNEKTSKNSSSTYTTKYWFDKNGLLHKMESEVEIITGMMKSSSKRTYFYEYDPTIKIEAPIK